jgi:D-glycero-D-manno-heptose 1,7-bisphosphate phosphatase
MKKAIFLDKDGTLIDDLPHNVDPRRMTLCRGAGAGLRIFARLGYRLLVVTNQPGIAKALFREAALQPVRHRMADLLQREHVRLHGFYYCPHHPDGVLPHYALACTCRKPQPGMLLQAAREHGIDLAASWMIGDILHDIEAGKRAGCKTVLINNGNETEWDFSAQRMPDLVADDLQEAAQRIASQTDLEEVKR